jgi:hypothetical protein
MKIALLIFGILGMTCLSSEAQNASSLPVPGTPNGDLATELLQSRGYCVGLENTLDFIEEHFPELSVDVLAARSAWLASPFAGGVRSIEADIRLKAGVSAEKTMKALDEAIAKEVQKRREIQSTKDALSFLELVAKRAKGEIEVEMVRGNLLWNYKPYQENPEREFLAGFIDRKTIETSSGPHVEFDVPMSWKQDKTENPSLMGFKNCYGHGNVWMTVLVSPATDFDGNKIKGSEMFDLLTEQSLKASWAALEIELLTFQKTKVNNMPAIHATRRQPYEQLGVRATRAAEVIRVFRGDSVINFQINTLGPEGQDIAQDRLKKNSALFRLIGLSLKP